MRLNCEMCGENSFLTKVSVEGTVLALCKKCARYGTPVNDGAGGASLVPTSDRVAKTLEIREKRNTQKDVYQTAGEEELVSDFGPRIVKARTAKGLSQEDFAKKISEKQGLISKVENQSMIPPDELVRKIEKFLGIKLMEKPNYAKTQSASTARGMTLGDFIVAKPAKKK